MSTTLMNAPIAEWTVNVKTWAGMSLGAEHFYAEVNGPGRDRKTIEYIPTDDEARRLMEKDAVKHATISEATRLRWAKTPTTRFWTREKALAAAVEHFKAHATGPAVLAIKDNCSGEAAMIAAAVGVPGKVVQRLNALGKTYEKAWRNHCIKVGFYFDLKPGARQRADRAGMEYRQILKTGSIP